MTRTRLENAASTENEKICTSVSWTCSARARTIREVIEQALKTAFRRA